MLTKRLQRPFFDLAKMAAICVKNRKNLPVVWENDRPQLPVPYLGELALGVLMVVILGTVLVEHSAVFRKHRLDCLPCRCTIRILNRAKERPDSAHVPALPLPDHVVWEIVGRLVDG